MTPIFRYNASRQVLVKQARMKEPDWYQYENDFRAYQQHIASLREYPVAPGDWKENRDYVEGNDFTIRCKISPCMCRDAEKCEKPIAALLNNKERHEQLSGTDQVCGKTELNNLPLPFPTSEPQTKCAHEWVAYTSDGKNRYCTNCHLMLDSLPDKITYSKSELIAEVEKAWEAAIKSSRGNSYIHFATDSIELDQESVDQEKKQYFKQNLNHDI